MKISHIPQENLIVQHEYGEMVATKIILNKYTRFSFYLQITEFIF